jgi:hypothetical protein
MTNIGQGRTTTATSRADTVMTKATTIRSTHAARGMASVALGERSYDIVIGGMG